MKVEGKRVVNYESKVFSKANLFKMQSDQATRGCEGSL